MKTLDRSKAIMYILSLSSVFKTGRVKEAVSALSSLYPEPVSEDRLLIAKNSKGSFLVYVLKDAETDSGFVVPELYIKNHCKTNTGLVLFQDSKARFNLETELKDGVIVKSVLTQDTDKEYDATIKGTRKYTPKDAAFFCNSAVMRKKRLRVALLSVFSVICIFFCIYACNMKNERVLRMQQNRELSEKQKTEKMKILEKEVAEIKSYYDNLVRNRNVKIKDALLVISGCLQDRSMIRTISIEGMTFSCEVYSDNSINTFTAFETDRRIRDIKLSRMTSSNGAEISSFSGFFAFDEGEEAVPSGLEEKKLFYRTKIESLENTGNLLSPSLYVSLIRDLLKESLCTLQSISQIQGEGETFVEVNFTCSPASLLSFLDGIQGQERNLNVTSFRIRNNDDNLAVVAVFDMGNNRNIIKDEHIRTSDDTKIKGIFTGVKQEKKKVSAREVLDFVGSGKSGGKNYILIKTDDGAIRKIDVENDAEKENTCMRTQEGYEVNFNGRFYEVRL